MNGPVHFGYGELAHANLALWRRSLEEYQDRTLAVAAFIARLNWPPVCPLFEPASIDWEAVGRN